MNIRKVIFSLVVLLAASVTLVAQGTYTPIDHPGATTTYCLGINTAGDVVGYSDAQEAVKRFS